MDKPTYGIREVMIIPNPEGEFNLLGLNEDNPNLKIGGPIRTSHVTRIDIANGVVETENTIYEIRDDSMGILEHLLKLNTRFVELCS